MILRAEQAQTLIDWFQSQGRSLCTPPYSSFDIRQFGNKMAPIDANLYPAGFNNIHPLDRRKLPRLWQNFFKNEFPNVKKILLVAEEHTLNTFYWDNVDVPR